MENDDVIEVYRRYTFMTSSFSISNYVLHLQYITLTSYWYYQEQVGGAWMIILLIYNSMQTILIFKTDRCGATLHYGHLNTCHFNLYTRGINLEKTNWDIRLLKK